MTTKRTTVTAALPYANGPIHIGHLAGVYVPADVYVRYLRNKGEEVVFISGSDEHGVPITLRAKNEGTTPQAIVDEFHQQIKKSLTDFGISFDNYSRTSLPIHHETTAEFFMKLYTEGVFEENTSEQFYDTVHDQFLADRYIKGECPRCGYKEAYGDQCENCGSSLSPLDLINPKSALSGEKPILKETKHWFIPLNKYEDWLREWIIEGHQEWKPNVYGQCKSWIDQGLQPRAVTRDLDWGVPVPLEEAEGKVIYVWFDAPIGYISSTKEWANENGIDWEKWWKSPDTRLIHFIGKDNIVFHCILFPVMLKAHGGYVVPENVPANEFLNLEGNKISTSRNWAVWLHEYLAEFPGKEDSLRYTLCANAPETKDNDFTWKDFQAKNNNELVAIYGNFVNRAVVLTHKYFDGRVPAADTCQDIDDAAKDQIRKLSIQIGESLDKFKFREALTVLMEIARTGNKYLADTEPWKLIKTDPTRVGTILNLSLQISANLAILSEPFLPFTVKKLWKILGAEPISWSRAGDDGLLPGDHKLGEPSLLFEKIEDEAIDAQVQKLENTKLQNEQVKEIELVPLKEQISYEDFAKLDMRIGTILVAEKVPKSKKLLKLKIHTGKDTRIIVSGISEHFQAEELIGKQVTLLVNLEPRKIMGIESNGMILMAEDPSGRLQFLPPSAQISDGSVIS